MYIVPKSDFKKWHSCHWTGLGNAIINVLYYYIRTYFLVRSKEPE